MWRANRGKMQREKLQQHLARQAARRGEPGFTLIELLLAMSFLSVLLIAITTSTMQIIGLYTKGVTLKSINLAGRDVADSFRRDALASADGIRYVSPDKGGGLGRLCFGTMSYVWSPAAKLQQGSAIRYQNDTRQGDVRGDMIVLARVADAGAQYCNPTARGTYSTDVFLSKATELLGSREGDLALRDLQINPVIDSTDGTHTIYRLRFVIGTNQQDTINTANQTCKPPTNDSANYNFCAINIFETLIQG